MTGERCGGEAPHACFGISTLAARVLCRSKSMRLRRNPVGWQQARAMLELGRCSAEERETANVLGGSLRGWTASHESEAQNFARALTCAPHSLATLNSTWSLTDRYTLALTVSRSAHRRQFGTPSPHHRLLLVDSRSAPIQSSTPRINLSKILPLRTLRQRWSICTRNVRNVFGLQLSTSPAHSLGT